MGHVWGDGREYRDNKEKERTSTKEEKKGGGGKVVLTKEILGYNV